MNYSLFIARRLSLSSDKRGKSPAIAVSITAVALSVSIMIASLAIVLGFKREIREKVIGFNSHISLYVYPSAEEEDNLLTMTSGIEKVLDEMPFVTDYSLEASIPAILKTSSDFKGVYLRSLNGESILKFLKSNLESGQMPDYCKPENANKILISRMTANQLNLKTGNKIDTYFLSDDIKARRLEVAGIFNSHFDAYDGVMIYGNLAMIQKVAKVSPTQGTSVQIYTDNFSLVPYYSEAISSKLDEAFISGLVFKHYKIENAYTQGAGYFNWLSLLDTNVIVILVLMVVVAVATLISGMLILILDKKRFIGVARALGASVRGVRKVFVYLALKVAFIGMAIGNLLMLIILYLQDRFHFIPLDPEAYYIDFVPVELNWFYILILNVVCFLIIYLSLILPSNFVARISPAESIRAEE